MKSSFGKNSLLLLSFLLFGHILCAAESNTNYTLELSAIKYSSGDSKSTPDVGDSEKTKTTTIKTGDLSDSYISASVDSKYLLYVYPFAAGTSISAGYMINDAIEVGLDLGINTSKSTTGGKDTVEDSNLYGIYVTSYFPIMGDKVIELAGVVDFTSGKTKSYQADTQGNPVEHKTEVSSIFYKLGVNYVHPVSKNFQLLCGIAYSMTSSNEKVASLKTNNGDFTVKLASVRMIFN